MRNKNSIAEVTAADMRLMGRGDETCAIQRALDKLARRVPAILCLDPGRVYTAKSLVMRAGVSIRGPGVTLKSAPSAQNSYLINFGPGTSCALEGIALQGAGLLRGHGNGVLNLKRVRLRAMEDRHGRGVFLLTERARVMARDCSVEAAIPPDNPAVAQDDAFLDWQGGEMLINALYFYDRAGGRIDTWRPMENESRAYHYRELRLGRPSGKLWGALLGTRAEFKRVLGDPRWARPLAAWKKHNAAQCGRLRLRIRGTQYQQDVFTSIQVNGCYKLDVRDAALGRAALGANGQSRVSMRGGELQRISAGGLSVSVYDNVRLIAPGGDDPWHPKTTYCGGYHNMEFGRFFHDLLPKVIFKNGLVDFAGDDCLNGLPEWRALQLMEVVHDMGSLFPNYRKLAQFKPETGSPGTRLKQINGQAGAWHNEDTKPVIPFDFSQSVFTWRGEYAPGTGYAVGDVTAFRDILYVCNRANPGVEPNALLFNGWQVFAVAFCNEKGYIQVAHRVRRRGRWTWERRQALGPWAGYTMRERGNPIVTYHVHLVLKNTTVIRRANTWSFVGISPHTPPIGISGYNYLLSCLVPNVPFNTEYNRVECDNVILRNIGIDAPPPIRGLCLGPNRDAPGRYRFRNILIVGESVGAPVCFRVDSEPLRKDNRVVLTDIRAEYNPSLPTDLDCRVRGYRLHYTGKDEPARIGLREVNRGKRWAFYEFLGDPPPDWNGIRNYIGRFVDSRRSADFLRQLQA